MCSNAGDTETETGEQTGVKQMVFNMNKHTVTLILQPVAATAARYLPDLEHTCVKIFVMCVQWEREQNS